MVQTCNCVQYSVFCLSFQCNNIQDISVTFREESRKHKIFLERKLRIQKFQVKREMNFAIFSGISGIEMVLTER